MNRIQLKLQVAAISAIVALSVSAGLAGDAKSGKGEELFNGKDLSGWVYPGMKGKSQEGMTKTEDGRIEVKDGAIVVNVGKGTKDLYTAKSFEKDFVLTMQFKAGAKADSGVYIRGNQLQIRDFIRRNEQKQLKNFKNDDWNDLEITVKGTEATFTVNGEALKPDKMKVPAKGPVGVQAETGTFEFRKVELKELP